MCAVCYVESWELRVLCACVAPAYSRELRRCRWVFEARSPVFSVVSSRREQLRCEQLSLSWSFHTHTLLPLLLSYNYR